MPIKHYDWSAYHANVRPHKVAIKDLSAKKELTFLDLDRRANKLAAWLQGQGVAKGDRVAILSQNCPEFFELEFACAKIGAVQLPLNWRLTKPELEYILRDSEPSVLIYDETFSEVSTALLIDCGIQSSLEINQNDISNQYEIALNTSHDAPTIVECYQEDLIMIMYTSGTTGHPKGAMITHQMQLYNAINLAAPALVTTLQVGAGRAIMAFELVKAEY